MMAAHTTGTTELPKDMTVTAKIAVRDGVNYSLTNENFSVQFTPDVGDVFILVAVTTDLVVGT